LDKHSNHRGVIVISPIQETTIHPVVGFIHMHLHESRLYDIKYQPKEEKVLYFELFGHHDKFLRARKSVEIIEREVPNRNDTNSNKLRIVEIPLYLLVQQIEDSVIDNQADKSNKEEFRKFVKLGTYAIGIKSPISIE